MTLLGDPVANPVGDSVATHARAAHAKPARVSTTLADGWFKQHRWKAFPFQREVWQAVAQGKSGLLHATTGSGKTYAVWLAALNRYAVSAEVSAPHNASSPKKRAPPAPPLTVLWITPMRALAADTERALKAPLTELNLPWSVGVRSGDTASAERARQSRRLPTALITTPESLTLLLSRPDAHALFDGLRLVVVDEWHELMGSKRGVQLQLALARLRQWQPALITWGLSATLGNLPYALEVLVPQRLNGLSVAHIGAVLVQGKVAKELSVDTLLPKSLDRFPWAGHLGLRMLPQVVEQIESSATSLIFTNTRSQSELWFQALLEARPDWAGLMALHHGSLDRKVREWVELALKEGRLKCVVCTSSLDLGVDFLPVERVLQIGSPKGVARLMQRAGRSGHAPGRPSRLTLVPTHSLELLESIAAQDAVAARSIEPRLSPCKPLDVLVQHLVTVALGGGFTADALQAEVKSTFAYRDLADAEWHWALAFVQHGGRSLGAYPDYRRAIPDAQGVWRVPDAQLARRHRMGIGTIVSDASMAVKFFSKGGGGKSLGTVEESFIARLKPGDHLLFAGRLLELVRVHEMTAYVRPATGKKPAVPRWSGGRMSLSSELATALVARLDAAATGHFDGPEMRLLKPLLDVQTRWSALPSAGTLLAWRIARHQPHTFSIAANDYGFEMLSAVEVDWAQAFGAGIFSTANLLPDVVASLNASELAQRRFREIARIAGLVFNGFPGASKSAKQLQASSSLFFEVFRKHDAGNLLLAQSQQEVLRDELDVPRLGATLEKLKTKTVQWQPIARATPFAFPLVVERLRESVTSEKLADRIARMVADLEKAANAPGKRASGPSGPTGSVKSFSPSRRLPRLTPRPSPPPFPQLSEECAS